MVSPFPGMDPYLEHPALWPGAHVLLISESLKEINAALPPGFVASIDERCYVVGPERNIYPDVSVITQRTNSPANIPGGPAAVLEKTEDPFLEVTAFAHEISEAYIEIRAGTDWQRVVTIIELLSPANKTPGHRGRDEYVRKQQEILTSETSLLEVDLLRAGAHTVCAPLEAMREKATWDYLVTLHESWRPGVDIFWPVALRDRLPRVRVPLTPEMAPVTLDLQAVFERAYGAGRFADRIDYTGEPSPALSPADSAWADALLKEKGVRARA